MALAFLRWVAQDSQLWAEKARRPQYTGVYANQDHATKMLEGALKGRGAKPAKAGAAVLDRPVDGDEVVWGDGGNNPAPLLHHFKQTTRDSASFPTYLEDKKVAVMFSEIKLRGPLEQLQSLSHISSNSLEKMIPEKNFSNILYERGSVSASARFGFSVAAVSGEEEALVGPDHLVGGTGHLRRMTLTRDGRMTSSRYSTGRFPRPCGLIS